MERKYKITGMKCESCKSKVDKALGALPGVETSTIDAGKKEVKIQLSRELSLSSLNDALADAGDYRLQEIKDTVEEKSESPKESLYPLLLIVLYISGVVMLITLRLGDLSLDSLMLRFMAGFFIVFSFFKFLDLPGFVDAYQSYDLLAGRFRLYGWLYPFIELALGVAYLSHYHLQITHTFTLLLMVFGSIGVAKALLSGRKIQCACLGTALNLPMTKVTLIEKMSMAAMAALMILQSGGI